MSASPRSAGSEIKEQAEGKKKTHMKITKESLLRGWGGRGGEIMCHAWKYDAEKSGEGRRYDMKIKE